MGRGGREGELWDDSALLTAFDDAMSNYKKMHGLSRKSEGVNDTSSVATIGEEIRNGDQSCGDSVREESGSGNAGLEVGTKLGGTGGGYDSVDGSRVADSDHAVPYGGYSDPQVMEEYNKLLMEYYEVEEKRQAVLQLLQQFGAYDYQYPAQGSGYDATLGACSTSYNHKVPAGQASLLSAACCCCSCACHSPAAVCSFHGCSADVECCIKDCPNNSLAAGPGKPTLGVDFFERAVEAAEAAISSLKMNTSGDSGVNEKESQKDVEGDTICSTTCETDLSMVLKAWFSAGLYTGKYLAEQSVTKK